MLETGFIVTGLSFPLPLQMPNVTSEYAAEIIDKFEVSDENKQRGVMGIEGKSWLKILF